MGSILVVNAMALCDPHRITLRKHTVSTTIILGSTIDMIDVARGDHHLRIVADLPLVHYVRDLRGAPPRQVSLICHVTAELEGLGRLG